MSGLIALLALTVHAGTPMLRLEGVDTRRCADKGLVRVAFTELELEGTWRAFAPNDYRVVIDGVALASPPISPRAFADTDEPLSLAIVVQVNLAWQRDLPRILASIEAFLGRLPPRTKTWLFTYGEEVSALAAAASPSRAVERLGAIRPSDRARAASRAAIRQALDAVQSLPGRTVVVVLSDGLDDAPSRDEIRALGNLARARRVPLMPIAYSPTDERGPFLDLSELARRSRGLFRWAEDLDDVSRELEGLADQLTKAWVIDYELPEPCERSHELQILRGDLRSEPQTILAEEQQQSSTWIGALIAVVLVVGGVVAWRVVRSR